MQKVQAGRASQQLDGMVLLRTRATQLQPLYRSLYCRLYCPPVAVSAMYTWARGMPKS